jgi:hypothetical protein
MEIRDMDKMFYSQVSINSHQVWKRRFYVLKLSVSHIIWILLSHKHLIYANKLPYFHLIFHSVFFCMHRSRLVANELITYSSFNFNIQTGVLQVSP